MSDKIISVNDFFCGAGGMGLGFKNAGFWLGGAWDFDQYAVKSYERNVSLKVRKRDITQMVGSEIPSVDVWTFGFPCQDVSLCGKRAGMVKGETRSGLFYEIMRLLDEVKKKPKIILAENVMGVKKYLSEIESEYKKRGYKFYYTLYNSKFAYVPQNRQRFFMLGVLEEIIRDFVFPIQQTDFVPKLSSILETDVDEKFYIDNEKTREIIEKAREQMGTVKTVVNLTEARTEEAKAIRREFAKVGRDFSPRRGKILVPRIDGIANCCTASIGKEQLLLEPILERNLKASHCWRSREFISNGLTDIAPTVCARDYKDPKNLWDFDQFRVRKFTPREYARLQAFPDSYEQVVSNSQFYKQMGNAVTVSISQMIAESIRDFLLQDEEGQS